MRYIQVRCPKCGASEYIEREPSDPEDTTVTDIVCPDCSGGDFDVGRNEMEPAS